jgi:hypothetical protein
MWVGVFAWVICILVIIFLIILLLSTFTMLIAKDFPTTIEVLNPNTLQTGDILTVGYRHGMGWFVTFWSQSVWSHTGIVWREPITKEVFVLEAANYGGDWNGVIKIPFQKWVKINKGSDICLNRIQTKGVTIDSQALSDAFEKIKGNKLEAFNLNWYRLLFKTPWKEELKPEARTCYELSIKMLQYAGIVQKKYMGSSYFPKHFVWNKLDMMPGFSYQNPVMLDPRQYYAQSENLIY